MIMKAYFYQDMFRHDPDPQRRKWAGGRVDVLTPICKAYPSDEAWSLVAESIQTYGGYGYCEDYPVAQAARISRSTPSGKERILYRPRT